MAYEIHEKIRYRLDNTDCVVQLDLFSHSEQLVWNEQVFRWFLGWILLYNYRVRLAFILCPIRIRGKSKEKRVLNAPLTIISIVEFGLLIVAGLACMIVPALPFWVGIIICYAVLAFSVIYFCLQKLWARMLQTLILY